MTPASTAARCRPGSRDARCSRRSSRRASRRSARGGCMAWPKPLRHARRQVPSRQVRRHHRPRRCADRGRARHDGARAPDRASAAAGRAKSWSSCGGRSSRRRPAASSTGSRSWSRTSAASATPFTICSTRSKWATSARATPTTRTTRIAARTTSARTRARTARARSPRTPQGMSMEEMEVSADELPDGASEAMDAPSADMPDDADMGDSEAANEPWRPRQHGQNEPRGPDYRAFIGEVRRDHRRRGSVRAGRARPLARLSRQAALASAGRGVAAGQPPAAPADGAAEPRLGVRPRGRPARSGAAVAHHHRSDARALVQAREGHQVPRHRGDAAARQFRLDARPPDHGGGDLRRHSGAHAGALRREGRDPRLHDARLEGRAVARGVARRPASRRIRAGSTICATSSTSRPTRRGGARARISA